MKNGKNVEINEKWRKRLHLVLCSHWRPAEWDAWQFGYTTEYHIEAISTEMISSIGVRTSQSSSIALMRSYTQNARCSVQNNTINISSWNSGNVQVFKLFFFLWIEIAPILPFSGFFAGLLSRNVIWLIIIKLTNFHVPLFATPFLIVAWISRQSLSDGPHRFLIVLRSLNDDTLFTFNCTIFQFQNRNYVRKFAFFCNLFKRKNRWTKITSAEEAITFLSLNFFYSVNRSVPRNEWMELVSVQRYIDDCNVYLK